MSLGVCGRYESGALFRRCCAFEVVLRHGPAQAAGRGRRPAQARVGLGLKVTPWKKVLHIAQPENDSPKRLARQGLPQYTVMMSEPHRWAARSRRSLLEVLRFPARWFDLPSIATLPVLNSDLLIPLS